MEAIEAKNLTFNIQKFVNSPREYSMVVRMAGALFQLPGYERPRREDRKRREDSDDDEIQHPPPRLNAPRQAEGGGGATMKWGGGGGVQKRCY